MENKTFFFFLVKAIFALGIAVPPFQYRWPLVMGKHCQFMAISSTSSSQRNSFTPGRTYCMGFGITCREESTTSHHLLHFPSLGLIRVDTIIWIKHDESIEFGLLKMGTFWKYLCAWFSDLLSSRDTVWVNSCSFGYFDIFSRAWR